MHVHCSPRLSEHVHSRRHLAQGRHDTQSSVFTLPLHEKGPRVAAALPTTHQLWLAKQESLRGERSNIAKNSCPCTSRYALHPVLHINLQPRLTCTRASFFLLLSPSATVTGRLCGVHFYQSPTKNSTWLTTKLIFVFISLRYAKKIKKRPGTNTGRRIYVHAVLVVFYLPSVLVVCVRE